MGLCIRLPALPDISLSALWHPGALINLETLTGQTMSLVTVRFR
jgi:hypothetical protein